MTAEELIKQAQNGDALAFETLLTSHYEVIYRIALKWCGNTHNAEDITQQASIKLAQNIRQFRFESAFTTWLYRLVINCGKDWQKQQSRHQHNAPQREHQAEHNPEYDIGTSYTLEAEAIIQLRQILALAESIDSHLKETLLLVFGEGLSHAQAAEVLEVKESTVSWRIHQFRKTLAQRQAEEEAKHAG